MPREKCPNCGSRDAAAILYGFPCFSDELNRKIAAKKVVLGGCCTGQDDPKWECNECTHRWPEGVFSEYGDT